MSHPEVVRVATWNLNGATGSRAQQLGALLRDRGGADVVLLQEAPPNGLDDFCSAASLDWAVSIETCFPDLLRVRGRDGSEASARPRGVAIAGVGEPLVSPLAFPDVPLPEKVMAGWINHANPITVVTYHAPAGVTHKGLKPAQAVQLARWLAAVSGPVIFGGDFNTPELDHPDFAQLRTHWHTGDRHLSGALGDDLLLGPDKVHALRDVLRIWFDAHPEDLAAAVRDFPGGPLAISHRTGAPRNPRRYDAIWVTDHFAVSSRPQYIYEAARAAGTDHALVLVELRPRTSVAT